MLCQQIKKYVKNSWKTLINFSNSYNLNSDNTNNFYKTFHFEIIKKVIEDSQSMRNSSNRSISQALAVYLFW